MIGYATVGSVDGDPVRSRRLIHAASDRAERGFAATDAPLDMRMDPTTPVTTCDAIINTTTRRHQPTSCVGGFARRIAAGIVRRRAKTPVHLDRQALVALLAQAIPAPAACRRASSQPRHSGAALAVNDELESLHGRSCRGWIALAIRWAHRGAGLPVAEGNGSSSEFRRGACVITPGTSVSPAMSARFRS